MYNSYTPDFDSLRDQELHDYLNEAKKELLEEEAEARADYYLELEKNGE